jgi:hypothetical protein
MPSYVARIGWPAETPSAVLTWTAPDESGIDRYRVAWYRDGYFVNSTPVDHPTTTVSLYDLAPGDYEFFVTVIGTDGDEGMPVSIGTKEIT